MSQRTIFKNVLNELRINDTIKKGRTETMIELEDMMMNPKNPSFFEDISQFDNRREYYGVLDYNVSEECAKWKDWDNELFIKVFHLKKDNDIGFISDMKLRIPRNECDDIYNIKGVCMLYCNQNYEYYIDIHQILILMSYYNKTIETSDNYFDIPLLFTLQILPLLLLYNSNIQIKVITYNAIANMNLLGNQIIIPPSNKKKEYINKIHSHVNISCFHCGYLSPKENNLFINSTPFMFIIPLKYIKETDILIDVNTNNFKREYSVLINQSISELQKKKEMTIYR